MSTTTGKLAGTLPAVNPLDDGSVELAGFTPDGRLLAEPAQQRTVRW